MSDSPQLILSVPERLAVLETKIEHLVEQHEMVLEKLETLLEFKHKGLGALGFASAIVGSSLLGAIVLFIDWMKGHQ